MTGSSKDKGHKGMYCNDNPIGRGVSQNCTVTLYLIGLLLKN